MAETLKILEFRVYAENALSRINRSYNESLLHLLLGSLFLRNSPLQSEVYRRWLEYTAKTPERVKYAIKDIIYNILVKPIRLEMGGRYFQLFGDCEKLQIPCNIPNFYFVLTLYPKLQPYFEGKRISSPEAIIHYTNYQYNDLLHDILRRDLICIDFLYYFLDPANTECSLTRRNIVNFALRELFTEIQATSISQSSSYSSSENDKLEKHAVDAIWSVAEKLGFIQQRNGIEENMDTSKNDNEICNPIVYEEYEEN